MDEVEPVLAQGAHFSAPGSGGERRPQVQAELLVPAQTRLSSRAACSGLGGSGSRLRGCGGRAFLATLRSVHS